MKDILFLTIRAEVDSAHERVSETIQEIEEQGAVIILDTPNVKVLDAEILLTRFRKRKK